jgi:hypothetical protein
MGLRLRGNGRRTETVNTSTAMCRNGTSSLQHKRYTPDATTPLLHINPLARNDGCARCAEAQQPVEHPERPDRHEHDSVRRLQ